MQDKFQEYYSLDAESVAKLWEHSVIVFDTNILLNFYRYSDNTVAELVKVLESLKERIWIPYHVGYEFHQERLPVIHQQINVYSKALADLETITKEFSNESRNPFLSENLFVEFTATINKAVQELKLKGESYLNRINNDDVVKQISNIFDGRVGDPFDSSELKEVIAKGEKRFSQKIPPGYEDIKKSDENRYGDLIIWFQMIKKAKQAVKPIIFVTDERKEDWWLMQSGKIVCPRPELRKEFMTEVNQAFYIYQPFKFLEYANQNLNANVKESVITEVKALKPRGDVVISQSMSDVLLAATFEEQNDNSNLEGFLQLLQSNGYEVQSRKGENNTVQLNIPIPNIPDLKRRINSKFLSQANMYGLKLLDFNNVLE